MTKEQLIWSARHERGLSDEQIRFFLDRESRWKLLPYYACFLKRRKDEQAALEEVIRMFGVLDVSSAELRLGDPENCQGNIDPAYEVVCENCRCYQTCYTPEPTILRNRAMCLFCGDIVESVSQHDCQTCSCGNLSVENCNYE